MLLQHRRYCAPFASLFGYVGQLIAPVLIPLDFSTLSYCTLFYNASRSWVKPRWSRGQGNMS